MEFTRYFIIAVASFYLVESLTVTQKNNVTIDITNLNGSYNVLVHDTVWLKSSPTFFIVDGKSYTTEDGSLIRNDVYLANGSDYLGTWTKMVITYSAGINSIDIEIKTYIEHDCIIFSQRYTDGADATRAATINDVVSGFPGFLVDDDGLSRGYLSFGGLNFGSSYLSVGKWGDSKSNINDGIAGGPLAIFDENGNCIIISPFSQFMAASARYKNSNGGHIHWGIMGGVDIIPPGYQYDTILFYGKGINKAFEGWGKLLRKWYGRSEKSLENDVTINYLGYWTSKGAYYYQYPESGKNYEETIIDIKSYMEKSKLPYRYFQFDSWWYYQGLNGGVKTWEPRLDVFPHGFSYIQNITKVPVALNSRYWSIDTTYAIQNNGDFSFVIGDTCAVPTEVNFWQYLFTQGKQWGMVLNQQDFLDQEFTGLDLFMTNLDLGRRWMMDIADGANLTKTNIQFSRAYPRHVMQALEIPFVTQARVSEDYLPGGDNWKIGLSSIFAHALGIAPFKDTFWTLTYQPGYEPYPSLHALVATLSTGPVGPGDMIGRTNVTMLMRCCSQNGMILKPGKPATASDRQIKERAFNGSFMELWTTESVYDTIEPGILKFGTVLAVDTPKNYTLKPEDLDFIGNGDFVVFEYSNPTRLLRYNATNGFVLPNCTREHFCLYHFVPKFNVGNTEIYLLGEVTKWVPISPTRIQTISVDGGHAILELSGQEGEPVTIALLMNGKFVTFTCTMGPSGGKTLWIMEGDCEP